MCSTKQCTKCGEVKSLSMFSISRAKKDGYTSNCKQCRKQYEINNKEKIAAYSKQYCIDNKEKKTAYEKQYRIDNKEKVETWSKQYRINNKEKIAAYKKQYRIDNKEKLAAKSRQYYHDNKDRYDQYHRRNRDEKSVYDKQYRIDNKEKIAIMGKLIRQYNVKNLTDTYIVMQLKQYTTLTAADIRQYPELIKLHRVRMEINRYISNI